MKGNNTMQLNEDTMIAAVQCYLDTLYQAGKGPQVVSVKPGKSGGGYGHSEQFEIGIKEPEGVVP